MSSRIWELLAAGKPAVGTYVTLRDRALVTILARAGLDFVRFDPHNYDYRGLLPELIEAARESGVTVWVRVDKDPDQVAAAAALGAEVITIPEVHSPADIERAVEATRRVSSSGGIAIGGQVEDVTGLASRGAIVATEGLRVVHSGRNDLAVSLGVPGEPLHPEVLAAEELIVEAALAADRQVSLHHPLTADGIRRARRWLDRGVRLFSFDADRALLARQLGHMAEALVT